MNARPPVIVVVALLATALPLAGCGSGSSTSGHTAPAATAPGTSSTAPGGTSTAGGGTSTAAAAGVAAVGACKGAVQAQSVPAGVKHKLESTCEKAASGNVEDIKRTAEQACEELVSSRIPAGSTRDSALARCVQH